MGVTAIRGLKNMSDSYLHLHDHDNPTAIGGLGVSAEPGQIVRCNMWIPWRIGSDQRSKVICLYGDRNHQQRICAIWQYGDYVRWSTEVFWKSDADHIPGEAGVNGDRILTVFTLNPVKVEMSVVWDDPL